MSASLSAVQISPLVARHLVLTEAAQGFTPATQEASAAVDELVDDFSLLDAWEDRYQHIIDLGKKLPALPPVWQAEAHKLQGCQSQVWLAIVPHDGRLYINAVSDSAIVSGLIAILRRVYNGRPATEIENLSTDFLAKLGLDDHLSPTRRNGLHAMVQAIRTVAAYVADKGL